MKKQRLSNIELLRVISMFLVLLVHADYFSLGAPTVDDIKIDPVDAFFRIFFESISIVCVNVFVLISGWFGIKPSIRGLCGFLFQCLFFLTGLYVITLIFGLSDLNLKGIAGCFFATRLNWFIKAYLLLYILSPVLNAFVGNSLQKEFKWVLIGFFLFTFTYCWSGAAQFMLDGYSTLFFIGLYLLARYIYIYKPRISLLNRNIDICIYFGTVILVTAVSLFCPAISGYMYFYISPTTVIGALFLLLYFTKLRIQSRVVNWLGISCFAVFLMHVSPSTLWHFKNLFVYLHSSLDTYAFWLSTFVILMIIFMVSVLVDKVRIMLWESIYNKFIVRIIK